MPPGESVTVDCEHCGYQFDSFASAERRFCSKRCWYESRALDEIAKKRSAASSRLKYRYGITLDQYEEMLSQQGGLCAICGRFGGVKRLVVDHDHACCPGTRSCGKCIRGLLCDLCNRLLGQARDNIQTLSNAVDYLAMGSVS